MLTYKHIFQVIYTEAILSNSTRELFWFEITEMLIAVLKHKCVTYYNYRHTFVPYTNAERIAWLAAEKLCKWRQSPNGTWAYTLRQLAPRKGRKNAGNGNNKETDVLNGNHDKLQTTINNKSQKKNRPINLL